MKTKFFLAVLLVLSGIWLGINLAKGKPLFSNPFADGDLQERAGSAASNLVHESQRVIDRTFKGN